MERERVTLILDKNARSCLGNGRELSFESWIERSGRYAAAAKLAKGPKFSPVATNDRQLQRRKDHVDVVDRATAHKRDGAAGTFYQLRKDEPERRRNPNLSWCRRKIDNRTVNVEQYRAFPQIGNEGRCGNVHNSTSQESFLSFVIRCRSESFHRR